MVQLIHLGSVINPENCPGLGFSVIQSNGTIDPLGFSNQVLPLGIRTIQQIIKLGDFEKTKL